MLYKIYCKVILTNVILALNNSKHPLAIHFTNLHIVPVLHHPKKRTHVFVLFFNFDFIHFYKLFKDENIESIWALH